MKKLSLAVLCLLVFAAGIAKAQNQVNNSGFENWENIGAATEEPLEWNSFKTGSGSLVAFTAQEIKRSPVVRMGATETYSCVLWSKSTLGIIANGNISTGQINADNMVPTDPTNYNITHTANPAFSETIGMKPDSLVIWVRFKPANATGTDSARIHAIIHDTYDCKDPIDAASLPHVVGEATLNFESTNNVWIRKSFPFVYNGAATSPDYILISVTTNKTPGGGSAGDSLYIDDMEMIYNGIGIKEINSSKNISVWANNNDIIFGFSFAKPTSSTIEIYSMTGQLVYNNKVTVSTGQQKVSTNDLMKGVYLVSIITENGQRYTQKIAIK